MAETSRKAEAKPSRIIRIGDREFDFDRKAQDDAAAFRNVPKTSIKTYKFPAPQPQEGVVQPMWADFLEGYDKSEEGIKIVFADFSKFGERLVDVFSQVDEVRVDERELLQLKQRGTASTYVAEYLRLVTKVEKAYVCRELSEATFRETILAFLGKRGYIPPGDESDKDAPPDYFNYMEERNRKDGPRIKWLICDPPGLESITGWRFRRFTADSVLTFCGVLAANNRHSESTMLLEFVLTQGVCDEPTRLGSNRRTAEAASVVRQLEDLKTAKEKEQEKDRK
ncbi:hypothetical protein GGTG_04471 [Gaeumannomyces tritici R3-111a-1]|uniref:Retrotransposon gag domain-containing protein n=1 Tax=Gaeumannomyces tritici (strain R3-111a-1) TaxID=644352 RepID=J3NT72_GAET3|nr:hypothetical protein GGTG_04471 [Gaeumannomyces tritici R3-111a-1]EJT79387.1 hypothetical protein GGTG_04471 [Gaeumannomyces tritici R3-111a-1]